MSGQTDPNEAPHFVVMALKEAGAEEFRFDGGPEAPPSETHWRWPSTPASPHSTDPVHWRTAVLHMGTRLRRAEEVILGLQAKVERLESVRPKPGLLTTEFWLAAIGAAPVVFITVAGQLEEFAAELPSPWGGLVKMGASAAVAFLSIRYGVGRAATKGRLPAAGDSQPVPPRGTP